MEIPPGINDRDVRALWDCAPVGLCVLDATLHCVIANSWSGWSDDAAHTGRTLFELAPQIAERLSPAVRRVLTTGKPIDGLELYWMRGDIAKISLCNLSPLRDAAGMVIGVNCALVDISTRANIEAAERRLSLEIDHRGQNLLSNVQSLVRMSISDTSHDVDTTLGVIEQRVMAMGRVHNVLSREKWISADIHEIVAAEFAPFVGQTAADGPVLRLTATAARSLALILHELVSNAVTHGALTVQSGLVDVTWTRNDSGLNLCWTERGGPILRGPPPQMGFGGMLIDSSVAMQLSGSIVRHWDQAGLRCVVMMGEAVLAGDRTAPASGVLLGRRVLIVDDEPISSAVLTVALTAEGCEVLDAGHDLDEAIAVIDKTGPFDAAVLGSTLHGHSTQPLLDLLRRRTLAIVHLGPLAHHLPDLADGAAVEPILDSSLSHANLCAAVMAALAQVLSATR
ncbi:MAG: PAS domain-containing protein [Acetobacteraceae bacterium]|nr:PAS domain-containing protein [Acetobacteraceae bacterium]